MKIPQSIDAPAGAVPSQQPLSIGRFRRQLALLRGMWGSSKNRKQVA